MATVILPHAPGARYRNGILEMGSGGGGSASDPARWPATASRRHPPPLTRPSQKVPCPDCGRSFHPRGLASHRRQKHGGAERSHPTPTGSPTEPLLAVLERIEARLARLETRLADLPRGEALEAGPPEPDTAMRARLEEVLAQVRAVRAEREAVEGDWAEERRRACDLELSRLRRDQARLLYELDELSLF